MKKLMIILVVLLISSTVWSQSPQKLSYQAVIRNSSNHPVSDKDINIRISILQGSVTGSIVYAETHSTRTNENGLIAIEIGAGTTEDDFSLIEWTDGPFFMKTETDPTGGANYTIIGTSQILSVPYALHSRTASVLMGEISESQISDLKDYLTDITNESAGDLADVNAKDVSDGQLLQFSAAEGKWITIDYPEPVEESDPVFTAWDKNYDDLTNKPDLSLFATKDMANQNISNLADPVEGQDAVTKAYVTLQVSSSGDTLFFGNDQYIVIPDLSRNNPLYEPGEPVSDGDGNIYPTVVIGTQTWMAENLRTSSYNDGSDIQHITDPFEWTNTDVPGYCWYDNDETNGDKYGVLYNWFVVDPVKTEGRNICPEGWHVPSSAAWSNLGIYLMGESVAGGKLKSGRTDPDMHPRWDEPNTAANNETSFNGLAGGYRDHMGDYDYSDDYDYSYLSVFWSLGSYGYWWTSSGPGLSAVFRSLRYNNGAMGEGNMRKNDGLSIRCLKNDLPIIITRRVYGVTLNSAISGGDVTFNGGVPVTDRGLIWNTTGNPTIDNYDGIFIDVPQDEDDDYYSAARLTFTWSEFTGAISDLSPGTKYYIRAYATNSEGTAYGNQIEFETVNNL